MTLPKYTLDYWKCTVDELRSFLAARTSVKPQKRREAYIEVLQKLDEEATFTRFLELPPELREMVYRELLIFDNKNRVFAFTDILLASKLIYKEALPILHEQSTFSLYATFSRTNWGRTVRNQSWVRIGPHLGPRRQISELVQMLQRNLSSVRNFALELKLECEDAAIEPKWSQPTQFLESVVKTCTKVRNMEVRVVPWIVFPYESRTPGFNEMALEVLKPLKNLPSNCFLDLNMRNQKAEDAFWKMANEKDESED